MYGYFLQAHIQSTTFSLACFHAFQHLTFIAIPHCAKVNIVLVIGEEKEAEPWVDSINGHNEEDPDNIALLIGATVATKVHIDLDEKDGEQDNAKLEQK